MLKEVIVVVVLINISYLKLSIGSVIEKTGSVKANVANVYKYKLSEKSQETVQLENHKIEKRYVKSHDFFQKGTNKLDIENHLEKQHRNKVKYNKNDRNKPKFYVESLNEIGNEVNLNNMYDVKLNKTDVIKEALNGTKYIIKNKHRRRKVAENPFKAFLLSNKTITKKAYNKDYRSKNLKKAKHKFVSQDSVTTDKVYVANLEDGTSGGYDKGYSEELREEERFNDEFLLGILKNTSVVTHKSQSNENQELKKAKLTKKRAKKLTSSIKHRTRKNSIKKHIETTIPPTINDYDRIEKVKISLLPQKNFDFSGEPTLFFPEITYVKRHKTMPEDKSKELQNKDLTNTKSESDDISVKNKHASVPLSMAKVSQHRPPTKQKIRKMTIVKSRRTTPEDYIKLQKIIVNDTKSGLDVKHTMTAAVPLPKKLSQHRRLSNQTMKKVQSMKKKREKSKRYKDTVICEVDFLKNRVHCR